MENKKIAKTLNLDSMLAALHTTQIDDIHSMVLRLRKDALFTRLPSWIENHDVPDGTVPSKRDSLDCLKYLNAQHVKEALDLHPVHAMDTLLESNNVTFTPFKVSSNSKTYSVKSGMILVGTSPEIVQISAGYTSTMLAYYTRGDEKPDRVVNAMPIEKVQDLGVEILDLTKNRIAVENYNPSVTKARDEMYKSLKENEVACFYAASAILQHLPNFSEENKALTVAISKSVKKKKKLLLVLFLRLVRLCLVVLLIFLLHGVF